MLKKADNVGLLHLFYSNKFGNRRFVTVRGVAVVGWMLVDVRVAGDSGVAKIQNSAVSFLHSRRIPSRNIRKS